MKSGIIFFVLFFVSTFYPQNKNSNINSLIAAEFSFAARAAEVNTRDAFIEFIAEDGILFRPTSVNGKNFLLNREPAAGLLSWYPVAAEISSDGCMGFTIGPWDYKKDKDSAPIAFGNFCTVWQLQKDGSWKFLIDFGNSNDKPAEIESPLKYNTDFARSQNQKIVEPLSADGLILLDKQFANETNSNGLQASYKKYIDSSTRLLRDELLPINGTKSIEEYLSRLEGKHEFIPADGKISSSKDIGYTYGTLLVHKSPSEQPIKYNYMRVWQKKKSSWIILAEVTNPLQ
ncbi:MAG: hypothetical protein HYS25_10630 [Ignavibacteriales bacterium]|nr:hypothetical protein [Ignavibacteriales bacterium]